MSYVQLIFVFWFFSLSEECPHPLQIDFASFETQIYKEGTILDCTCKPGYDRKEGTPLFIVCVKDSKYPSWRGKCQCKSKSPESHEEQSVTSTPINHGKQTDRNHTTIENRLQTYNLTSHCQEPVLWNHASETKSYQFVVGQKLQYHCLKNIKYRDTTKYESTCWNFNGKPSWTNPNLKCTNDTSIETSVPSSFTTEHKIAIAACIFLVSFVIFLVWITWRKRWRKRRQTDKEKTKKREVRSQQYFVKNDMPDHPEGLLST
ncbi:interleukin-2 receptor subunit alpha isoform X2 [Macrotis lagotis]|uniref:interleukin-2 receptor subunit alpha isoform X2 n=1 Tax=Macrotis lagotis TaxID=92651 RepID=UPI003D68FF08